MKKLTLVVVVFVAGLIIAGQAFAESSYQKPPQNVMDVLNAPAIPATSVSPARDKILILEPLRYPPITELAQPMLRLAGLRINPNTNGQYRQPYFVKLTLKNIADGKETPIDLPPNAQIITPNWSADGKYIAAGNQTPNGIELWVIETATGKAQAIKNVRVNTAFGRFDWMPDQKSLLVNLVPTKRETAPSMQNIVPTAPSIQETSGKTGAAQTFQDLLKSPNDEKLFDYYAISQLAVVGVDGQIREIGQPAIFETADISPDGQNILIARIEHPYSYLYPSSRFPKEVEVWDLNGKLIHKIASLPLADNLPVEGVPIGARDYDWIPTENASLIWVEALDEGNPKNKAAFRDKVVKLAYPFDGQPNRSRQTRTTLRGQTIWRARRFNADLRLQPRHTLSPFVCDGLSRRFARPKSNFKYKCQRPLQRHRAACDQTIAKWFYGDSTRRR